MTPNPRATVFYGTSSPMPSPEADDTRRFKPVASQPKHTVIEPGGNRVCSYLEVTAPAGLPWSVVRKRLISWLVSQDSPLPWNGCVDDCRFSFAVEASLAAGWRSECGRLLHAIEDIRGTEHERPSAP